MVSKREVRVGFAIIVPCPVFWPHTNVLLSLHSDAEITPTTAGDRGGPKGNQTREQSLADFLRRVRPQVRMHTSSTFMVNASCYRCK